MDAAWGRLSPIKRRGGQLGWILQTVIIPESPPGALPRGTRSTFLQRITVWPNNTVFCGFTGVRSGNNFVTVFFCAAHSLIPTPFGSPPTQTERTHPASFEGVFDPKKAVH